MGLFDSFAKAAGSVGNAISGVVKGIARNVSKVASSVAGAIAGGDGIIARAYGKVKSFGSMAVGMLFPSASGDTIRSLQSVTSSAMQAGSTDFVNTFGNSLISASSNVKSTGFAGITQKIKDGFSWVGGKIKDAATRIYEKTVEFLGGDKKTSDPGAYVASQAKAAPTDAVGKLSQQSINIKSNTSGFMVDSGIYDSRNGLGISSLIGKPEVPLSLEQQPLNVQYDAAVRAGMSKSVVDTSRKLGISPFAGAKQANTILEKGLVGSGLMGKDLPPPIEPIIRPSTVRSTPSLMDKIMGVAQKYGPALLEGYGAGLEAYGETPYTPTRSASASMIGSNRMGIGGQGSAGGDFLTQAQRAFLNQQASKLEQIG